MAGEYIARAVLAFYDGLITLLVWLLLVPIEGAAVLFGRSTRARLSARLGRPPRALSGPGARHCADGGRLIVVHAVSVGEMAAAAALVRRWTDRHPEDRLLLTAGHRDGLAAGERLAAEVPAVVAVVPLPWDRRRAMHHWLGALAPDLVVGIENEIWPGLYRGCQSHRIPLVVASARIYAADLKRYRMLPGFFRGVLAAVDWVGAQSAVERRRWCEIGVPPERVEVVGNLKYDTAAPGAPGSAEPCAWHSPGALRIFAASTHPGEESWLLRALAELPARSGRPQLVLAPRNPRRAAAIARAARRAGFAAKLLQECEPALLPGEAPPRVIVVDRLGWLPRAIAAADLVVLGGTFVRRGGHNPLEAARAGRALVVGPYVENFTEVMTDLRQRGALREVARPRGLAAAWVDLLGDPDERRRLGTRAAAAVTAGSCVERYVDKLEALLATHAGQRNVSRSTTASPALSRRSS